MCVFETIVQSLSSRHLQQKVVRLLTLLPQHLNLTISEQQRQYLDQRFVRRTHIFKQLELLHLLIQQLVFLRVRSSLKHIFHIHQKVLRLQSLRRLLYFSLNPFIEVNEDVASGSYF